MRKALDLIIKGEKLYSYHGYGLVKEYSGARDITIGEAIEKYARAEAGDDAAYLEKTLRACDDQYRSMIELAAVDYLIKSERCGDWLTIMEDDWNKIADALGSVTRESTWGDICDIVNEVIPEDYDAYEIIKSEVSAAYENIMSEVSAGGAAAAREGEDMREYRLVEYIGTNGVYTILDESDNDDELCDRLCDRCDAIAPPAAVMRYIRGEFRAIHGNAAYQDMLREEQHKRLAEIDERLAEINEERERLMEHRELLQRVINR